MSWICCCRKRVMDDLPADFLIISPVPVRASRPQDIKVSQVANGVMQNGGVYVGSYNTPNSGYPSAIDGDLEITDRL